MMMMTGITVLLCSTRKTHFLYVVNYNRQNAANHAHCTVQQKWLLISYGAQRTDIQKTALNGIVECKNGVRQHLVLALTWSEVNTSVR